MNFVDYWNFWNEGKLWETNGTDEFSPSLSGKGCPGFQGWERQPSSSCAMRMMESPSARSLSLNQAGHQVTILRWDEQGVLPWRDGSCDFTEHHAFHRSSSQMFSEFSWLSWFGCWYHCHIIVSRRSLIEQPQSWSRETILVRMLSCQRKTTCRCRVHRHEDVVHRGNMRRALLKLVYWRLWRHDGEMMDRLGTNHGYIYIYID